MAEFNVSRLKGTSVSADGRRTVLKFESVEGGDLWINIDALALTIAMQDIGSLLTRSRELSEISKQNIVPVFRPTGCRADVAEDKVVVPPR